MPFNHIKAFLKKRDETVPHESDYVTSSEVENDKRALDIKDASLDTHRIRRILEDILCELKIANLHLSEITQENFMKNDIKEEDR